MDTPEEYKYYTVTDLDADKTVTLEGFRVIDEEDFFDVEGLFSYAASKNCSDIHLKPGSPPKLRIHGELEPISGLRSLTSDDTDNIRQEVMSDPDQGEFINRRYDHVFAYEILGVARFRMIATRALGGITLNARKLVETPPSFDDLGVNPSIRDLANFKSGLIIVAGITGSGKSTLMAAMIDAINSTQKVNIISIEDPVEILHKDKKANIIQRNIGTDLLSFSDGVRDAMRQDPDIILIGEIRDKETAQACLKAAETGHLVISTIHGMTSIASIGRMLDLFSNEEQTSARNRFADVLRGIVTQKLVRSTAKNGQLVPVNEILLNNIEFKKAIENNLPPTELREILISGKDLGMQTFEQDFQNLVLNNIVTEKVAMSLATFPDEMKELLDNIRDDIDTNRPIAIADPTTGNVVYSKTAPKMKKLASKNIPFSQVIKKQEEESGIVIKPSGAAFEKLPPPIRPQIFLPNKRG